HRLHSARSDSECRAGRLHAQNEDRGHGEQAVVHDRAVVQDHGVVVMPFATIQEAAELYRSGTFVIIVDDEDRENEGELYIAAEKITPAAVNFMARYGRGLICLALTEERCNQLELPLMVENNTAPYGTAFTVSIEARGRVTTGISAYDRAETVRVAIDPRTRP